MALSLACHFCISSLAISKYGVCGNGVLIDGFAGSSSNSVVGLDELVAQPVNSELHRSKLTAALPIACLCIVQCLDGASVVRALALACDPYGLELCVGLGHTDLTDLSLVSRASEEHGERDCCRGHASVSADEEVAHGWSRFRNSSINQIATRAPAVTHR